MQYFANVTWPDSIHFFHSLKFKHIILAWFKELAVFLSLEWLALVLDKKDLQTWLQQNYVLFAQLRGQTVRRLHNLQQHKVAQ